MYKEWSVAEHSLMHQLEPDARISRMKSAGNLPRAFRNSEAQRIPAFPGETDHIEYGVFHSNLLQMENALPAVCARRMPGRCHSVGQSGNRGRPDKDKCISLYALV